ncbi:hypothetical protein MMC10_003758 [Thelotrema lepadinum]|nr:hypothetical protein [Thelotrema lepadinum]
MNDSNYRLGAFGWLAGAYMEKKAQPNAGLLDQRAMLSFVQDQISQVYGDPSRVSVWGESAGASSIMHHLVMPQDKPLFRNALLQSPAYQWLWDRAGSLNDTYTTFAQIAGCTDGDIDCLRDLPISNLTAANQDLFQNQAACNGIMPVGPSVDGKLVTDLAVNLINDGQGKFLAGTVLRPTDWKLGMNLESILVSHVDLEVPYSASLKGMSFIPYPIRKDPQNADKFNDFLDAFADGSQYADIKTQIQEQYPVQGTYPDQIARAAAVIANSSFLCHTRFLIDAYQPEIPQNTFALHYAFGTTEQKNAAVHGSDLPPLFRRKDSEYQTMLSCLTGIKNSGLANKTKLNTLNGYIKNFVTPGMQTYFVNQAVGNNPGKQRGNLWSPVKDAVPCPSGDGTCVGQVMKAVTVLPWSKNNTTDPLTSSSYCDFWKGIAKDIMKVAKQLESAMGAEIDDSSQLVLKEL